MSGRFIDTDPQLAIGIARRRLVTTTAARDDFRKEYTDSDMNFSSGITGAQHRDLDILFIDASSCGSRMQRQYTGTQAHEVGFQDACECIRIPGAQAVAKAGHWQPRLFMQFGISG